VALPSCDPRELNGAALRLALAQEIARFVPTTERGTKAQRDALAAVQLLERPMDELGDLVHVTASGFVMSSRGLLLHEHKSLMIWLQLGGHIEPGEWPPEAAVREACEETGLACRHACDEPLLVRVDVHPGPRGHTHLDLGYLLTSAPVEPCPPEGESQSVSWFSLEEAQHVAAPDLLEFLGVLERHWNDLKSGVVDGVTEA
jgi:8-oxo-dGTP pyrophosphatase MutT (NUDIX family)